MHKRKTILIGVAIILLCIFVYFIGSGFTVRNDVALLNYKVNEAGTEVTLYTTMLSSMGHVRGFKDEGGGVKPHYLKFYQTFGGINSTWGAKGEYTLPLGKDDTEIYFSRPDGGYALILQKDAKTGEWIRP